MLLHPPWRRCCPGPQRHGSHQAVLTAQLSLHWALDLGSSLPACSKARQDCPQCTFIMPNQHLCKPEACRMAISVLERRFLELISCCQIQLASGLLEQRRNLPRQPSARDTCAWANRSKDKPWPVEPEPRTWHPTLKLTPKLKLTHNHQGAKHLPSPKDREHSCQCQGGHL